MSNDIQHPCNFCKRPVKLSPENRTFVCTCGVTYTYKAPKHKPGKGYTARKNEGK